MKEFLEYFLADRFDDQIIIQKEIKFLSCQVLEDISALTILKLEIMLNLSLK
jgi:hypothetical protein